jgi:hypothetical protein
MLKRFIFVLFILWGSYVFSQDLGNLKHQKPFNVSGSAMLSLNYYESSNAIQTYQPFSYLVAVNVTPAIYGFSVPLSFTYTKMNKSFNHPFYRFGLSPTYKWVTLHLGHRSTNFSRFTVSGQKSFGVGIELTPGKFRFAFLYGKFKKDNAYKTIYDDELEQDEYTLKGYAVKIGVGSQKNYFDLVFMHIADNTDDFSDTSLQIHPESNVVVSAITQLSIAKNLKFNAEIAASVFTQNMFATEYDMDDLPKLVRNMSDYLNINTSTSLALATDVGLEYKLKKFSAGVQYQRIDPGYKSLGTNYIRNDFEQYALKSSYKFKIGHINGSVGLMRDNLKNTKLSQANRLTYTLGVALTPSGVFSVKANYSNFSTKQTEGRVPLNDTIRLFQVNKNISVMPQLRFVNSKSSNIIMANYTYANLVDKNSFAEYAVPVVSNTAFLQYMYSAAETGLGISANINYTDFKTALSRITNIGPTVGANKTMLKKKGTAQLSLTYLRSNNNSVKGNIYSARVGYNYKISKSQQIKFSYFFTKSKYPEDATVVGYNNSRGVLAYVYKF